MASGRSRPSSKSSCVRYTLVGQGHGAEPAEDVAHVPVDAEVVVGARAPRRRGPTGLPRSDATERWSMRFLSTPGSEARYTGEPKTTASAASIVSTARDVAGIELLAPARAHRRERLAVEIDAGTRRPRPTPGRPVRDVVDRGREPAGRRRRAVHDGHLHGLALMSRAARLSHQRQQGALRYSELLGEVEQTEHHAVDAGVARLERTSRRPARASRRTDSRPSRG